MSEETRQALHWLWLAGVTPAELFVKLEEDTGKRFDLDTRIQVRFLWATLDARVLAQATKQCLI